MIALTILLIIIALAWFIFFWRGMNLDHINSNGIVFFGHRGLRYSAPENTIQSYQAAISNGLRAIELDVRLTKDGKIVCSHNIDLDRETNGSGFIDEMTYKELLRIKAGRQFPVVEQTKIPLLEEILEQLPKDILLNIEIKSDSIFDLDTAKEVIKLIKNNKIKQRIIVSSFNPLVVRYIKFRSKNTPTGYIYEYAKHFIGVLLARPDCLHPDAEFIDDRLIKFCKKRRMSINVWTVNNPYARDWLIDKGINGIITDNPNIAN